MYPRSGRSPSQLSRAKRTTNASTSAEICGRPGYVRPAEPSNLAATSRRYQPRMVSGWATWAMPFITLRPTRLAISASAPLRIVEAQPGRQMGTQNAVLGQPVLIRQQQFLIDQPRHEREQGRPMQSIIPVERSSYPEPERGRLQVPPVFDRTGIQLIGTKSNREGLGARVEIEPACVRSMKLVTAAANYLKAIFACTSVRAARRA